jgi:serine/threonine protein kinase
MYLVMELVKGGDLFDCIVEKQRYSEMEARRAMRRLLSAIHYLHEESNIVHRDLKPENVLCSSPTDVKLADFGLAKILKADGLKTFCGTPAYFAPEVLQRRGTVAGQGRYGKPADIWSLGVILYILLTGKPPFDADIDEPRAFNVDFDSDHHIWSQMATAKELVEQMLHQDPKQRLTVC